MKEVQTSHIAINLFSLKKFCQTLEELAQTLKKIKDIGYNAVQISGVGPIDSKEIAKAARDADITIAATHVAWSRFVNQTDAVIAEHEMWNCVHSAVGWLPIEYRGLKGLEKFLMELPPVVEKLWAAGIDFSYHNHSHELARFNGKTWLEMLYERTNPANLKAEIDTYWIQHGGGNPVVWIRKCAGRIPLLHIKDMTITEEREQRFAEIGEGNMSFADIFTAAKESSVEWYIVEQDNCYDRDPFDSAAISYRNILQMWRK
jgi:sugar phosphate isomerase/epimerase